MIDDIAFSLIDEGEEVPDDYHELFTSIIDTNKTNTNSSNLSNSAGYINNILFL